MAQAGPAGPAEVFPRTAIRITLGIQDLRTRIFRSVELKYHPLRIRNARIRRRVEEPHVIARELKVYGMDVVLQLLGLAGSDDHAADRRPSQHPRKRNTGRACIMPTSPLPSALRLRLRRRFSRKMEETTHPSKIRPPAPAVLGLAVILSILGSGVYIVLFGLK